MNSELKLRVDNHTLLKVENLIPNLNKYSLGEDFRELYNKNVEFVQICFIDRTKIENRYISNETNLFTSLENAELVKKNIEDYNEVLKVAQKESANDLMNEFLQKTYFYFCRVGTDIGFCNLYILNRNKTREEQEEQEEQDKHIKKMKEDPLYRKQTKWFEEKDRPFGGAFSSWEEYYNYK